MAEILALVLQHDELEWALRTGQSIAEELTGATGSSENENHGPASQSQRRVQTSGGAGVHQQRDAAWTSAAARRLPAT